MARIRSFAPLGGPKARVLILGSMPGQASLDAGEYYAHPQNAFWPIMGKLLGADPLLPYRERVAALIASGVALWDVLASCERTGSLDTGIRQKSIVTNDFAVFLKRRREIGAVMFNGGMAETTFRRHVMPTIAGMPLRYMRLPSTSPANASFTRLEKLEAWRNALRTAGISTR